MAATTVKPEIKLDPAAESTSIAQLEEFEEDNDLHMPSEDSKAWLVKIPEHLWKAWNEIYRTTADAEPIEIGKMRVFELADGESDLDRRCEIRLAPGVPQHVDLPKLYAVKIKTAGYSNVVAFSEKDLPGHHARRDVVGRARAHLKPQGIPFKSERYGSTKPGTYRSAIPKQTALAPLIHHQADATPVQDASYDAYMEKSYRAAMQPKSRTRISHKLEKGMHPGTRNSTTFTLSSRVPGTATRKPRPKEKAVRMDQKDLLDAIYKCFQQYRYWSLKALKFRLKQPEAYIKQMLEGIAFLVRSGDFAMNYKLKDEYEGIANIKQDEVKDENAVVKSEDEGSMAEDAEMDDEEDDEDDDELDLEDVKMEDGS